MSEIETTQDGNDSTEMTAAEEAVAPLIRIGDLVHGTFVGLEADRYKVDIAGQTGWIAQDELSEAPAQGTELELFVDDLEDESLILSVHKVERIKLWGWLEDLQRSGEAVDAVVISESRGELAVDLGGIRACLAFGELARDRERNISSLLGETLSVRVTRIQEKKARIVVSERALLEGDRAARKQITLESLEVGQEIEGEVRRIARFGAFVDIGGVDGLLHVKDLSWRRIDDPAEVVRVGDFLTLKVLQFDPETEKVGLGLKQMQPDPWLDAVDRYVPGTAVQGQVVGMTDFGCFVMLNDGIEGLVHVSEMSWTEDVKKPGEKVKRGETITAWVLRCEVDRRRLGLTLKDPADNPWHLIKDQYDVGDRVNAAVARITDFGVFIELGHGLQGLIHVSDFSWGSVSASPDSIYSVGDEIEAMVLDIDVERGRASLGIKQLSEDLTSELLRKYQEGQEVSARVSSIQSYGVFLELEPGLEGLMHVSVLMDDGDADLEDRFEIGQVVNVVVSAIDTHEKRVSLGLAQSTSSADEDEDVADVDEPAVDSTPQLEADGEESNDSDAVQADAKLATEADSDDDAEPEVQDGPNDDDAATASAEDGTDLGAEAASEGVAEPEAQDEPSDDGVVEASAEGTDAKEVVAELGEGSDEEAASDEDA